MKKNFDTTLLIILKLQFFFFPYSLLLSLTHYVTYIENRNRVIHSIPISSRPFSLLKGKQKKKAESQRLSRFSPSSLSGSAFYVSLLIWSSLSPSSSIVPRLTRFFLTPSPLDAPSLLSRARQVFAHQRWIFYMRKFFAFLYVCGFLEKWALSLSFQK